MAKSKSNTKELKLKEVIKEEIVKDFPTSKMVKIILKKDNKEYLIENSTAKAIVDSKRGKLV